MTIDITTAPQRPPDHRPDISGRRGRTLARRWAQAVGVAAVAGAVLTGVAAQADAAAGDYSQVGNGWNLRSCGYVPSCGIYGYTTSTSGSQSGYQWDQTWCWHDGDYNRWFKVTAHTSDGWHTGWIIADAVPAQAQVPWCNW